jgi:hypothetical protein
MADTQRKVCALQKHAWARTMAEVTSKNELGELVKEIDSLPASQRKKLKLSVEQTKHRYAELKKSVFSLQDSLDYLRQSIKYLLFDLETARRENLFLRKMLKEMVK